MGTDDETFRQAGDGSADGRRDGPADPVRDLLLGLAAQIDHLAALFAPAPQSATAGGADATGTRPGFAAFADGGPLGHALSGASGEITSLLAEIGDLVARLIAAVIAVLEAIAEALRSSPTSSASPRQYEPIAVRFNGPAAGREAGTQRRGDASRRATPPPEPGPGQEN
ncbi:hypothetical protein O4159_05685 [Gordonia terrae]|uniref:hypothetical protein n=1 Tax=Gordonia hongkongensis TaxID=1701090 RepID=UPI0022B50192|nr:hypothetical protein [Gordonia terrae]